MSEVIFKCLGSSSNVWSKAMFKGQESSSNVWSHLQTSWTTNVLNHLETSGVIFKQLHFQSSFLPISIFFRNPGQAETELLMRRKEFLDEIHQVPFNTTQNIHKYLKMPKSTQRNTLIRQKRRKRSAFQVIETVEPGLTQRRGISLFERFLESFIPAI